jgi:hypothetical protein
LVFVTERIAISAKSGKKGFKRPGLSETLRAALRLVQNREWSSGCNPAWRRR